MTDAAQDSDPWISKWLDAVHTGSATMSQRSRSTIDRHGGLGAVIAAAKARGLHLVGLTDDKGILLVAASVHPFTTLCRPGIGDDRQCPFPGIGSDPRLRDNRCLR